MAVVGGLWFVRPCNGESVKASFSSLMNSNSKNILFSFNCFLFCLGRQKALENKDFIGVEHH